jgi:hypothetical protein
MLNLARFAMLEIISNGTNPIETHFWAPAPSVWLRREARVEAARQGQRPAPHLSQHPLHAGGQADPLLRSVQQDGAAAQQVGRYDQARVGKLDREDPPRQVIHRDSPVPQPALWHAVEGRRPNGAASLEDAHEEAHMSETSSDAWDRGVPLVCILQHNPQNAEVVMRSEIAQPPGVPWARRQRCQKARAGIEEHYT